MVKIKMYLLNIKIELDQFDGDSLFVLDSLQENFSNNSDLLKRGLPKETLMKISISQIGSRMFQIRISVLIDDSSLSEDTVIGQLESNVSSMKNRGIISLSLHKWDLLIHELSAKKS